MPVNLTNTWQLGIFLACEVHICLYYKFPETNNWLRLAARSLMLHHTLPKHLHYTLPYSLKELPQL